MPSACAFGLPSVILQALVADRAAIPRFEINLCSLSTACPAPAVDHRAAAQNSIAIVLLERPRHIMQGKRRSPARRFEWSAGVTHDIPRQRTLEARDRSSAPIHSGHCSAGWLQYNTWNSERSHRIRSSFRRSEQSYNLLIAMAAAGCVIIICSIPRKGPHLGRVHHLSESKTRPGSRAVVLTGARHIACGL